MVSRIAHVNIVLRIGAYVTKTRVATHISAIVTNWSDKIKIGIEHFDTNQGLVWYVYAAFFVNMNRIRVVKFYLVDFSYGFNEYTVFIEDLHI